MQEWEKIKNKLNLIKLAGCEDVCIGDVLHYSLKFYYDDAYDIISAIKSIRRIIAYSFLTTYKIWKIGEGNNIFFLSNSISNRTDHSKNMRTVMTTVDNRIDIVSSNYKLYFGNMFAFPIIFIWNKSLKNVFPNWIRRFFFISHLYRVFLDYNMIKRKLTGMSVKSFVTYCDVLEADNYFAQMMHQQGVTTVTLQHGLMSSREEDTWAVLGSKSDYFFCQGEYMLDVAKELNLDCGRMKITGLVSYADRKERPRQLNVQQKTIGVILDGYLDAYSYESNRQMIEITSSLGELMGVKVLYKIHPTFSLDDYSDVVRDPKLWFGKETNIDEFISMIDVGVAHYSTGFLEILYNDKLVCIYRRNNIKLSFCNGNITTWFDDLEELAKIFKESNDKTIREMVNSMKSYFVGEEKTYYAYRKAFAEIGII